MTDHQTQAINLIEQQQKGIEYTAPWMVGEQLKDICRQEPENAELIAQDLAVPEMSLVAVEKKIKAWADKHKPGPRAPSACTPPNVAENILRKFYGLKKSETKVMERSAQKPGLLLDITDFL